MDLGKTRFVSPVVGFAPGFHQPVGLRLRADPPRFSLGLDMTFPPLLPALSKTFSYIFINVSGSKIL